VAAINDAGPPTAPPCELAAACACISARSGSGDGAEVDLDDQRITVSTSKPSAGAGSEAGDGGWTVTVPFARRWTCTEVDLIEEVARGWCAYDQFASHFA